MDRYSDAYTIIARLVNDWPGEDGTQSEALADAQTWLKTHRQQDIRTLAHDTLAALDTLLRSLQGGVALDVLLNAREALANYLQREAEQTLQKREALTVKSTPAGGVTLLRKGQHFTIDDEELDAVREAVNARKREVRKRQRRAT